MAACGSTSPPDEPAPAPEPAFAEAPAPDPGRRGIGPEPQREGDPARGFEKLLGEGYVGCGVPRSLFDRFWRTTPEWMKVPGRTGAGADLPYFVNAYTDDDGTELVTANCLGCHAGYLRGELVVGLGDPAADFTMDVTSGLKMAGLMIRDPKEKAAWNKLVSRVSALAPYIRTRTVGANPADVIAAVLFAHRDPETLAWSDEPLMKLPPRRPPVPLDTPAWWLMKKKNTLYWTGAGRGDHARLMMTVSVLCVDDVETAREIDAYFPDIRAYIASLEPPAYPGEIDRALAERGREEFEVTCSGCHGSYGDEPRYPNRIVPVDEVGTDPALHEGSAEFTGDYARWYNRSFYGGSARLEEGDGYVAPPLDGIWATAPYFHNGSVPTIEGVLDSSKRPDRFRRRRGSNDYGLSVIGWKTDPVTRDADPDDRWIYDTSLRGYSNAGHTFADDLEPAERRALLEYLKTL